MRDTVSSDALYLLSNNIVCIDRWITDCTFPDINISQIKSRDAGVGIGVRQNRQKLVVIDEWANVKFQEVKSDLWIRRLAGYTREQKCTLDVSWGAGVKADVIWNAKSGHWGRETVQ